jgi:hypothetical protein
MELGKPLRTVIVEPVTDPRQQTVEKPLEKTCPQPLPITPKR